MKRKIRLNRTSDYLRVRRFGKSQAHPLLVLVFQANDTGCTHFAVSAGRSVGNAVQRNRAKRLIRACLEPLVPTIARGWDIILIARRPLASATFTQAQAALTQILQRARLIENVRTS